MKRLGILTLILVLVSCQSCTKFICGPIDNTNRTGTNRVCGMANPKNGTYIVDDSACVNGTVCSMMYNLNGPQALNATSFCMVGNKTSEVLRDILFGTDAETRYPGDICVPNVTNCFNMGYCLNGTCMASNPSVGAPCEATGDCNVGQYCDIRARKCVLQQQMGQLC